MNKSAKTQTDEQLISEMEQNSYYVAKQMEMTRRLKEKIVKMDKSINTFNKASSKQAKTMIKLTRVITVLTVIIGLIAIIQIFITIIFII